MRKATAQTMPKKAIAKAGAKPAAKNAGAGRSTAKPVVKKAAPAGRGNGGTAPRPAPAKAAAGKSNTAAPAIQHISPEEAVAHIQALLEAKQERTRKAADRPADEQPRPHGESAVHTPVSPGLPSDMPDNTIPVHTGQRGAKI